MDATSAAEPLGIDTGSTYSESAPSQPSSAPTWRTTSTPRLDTLRSRPRDDSVSTRTQTRANSKPTATRRHPESAATRWRIDWTSSTDIVLVGVISSNLSRCVSDRGRAWLAVTRALGSGQAFARGAGGARACAALVRRALETACAGEGGICRLLQTTSRPECIDQFRRSVCGHPAELAQTRPKLGRTVHPPRFGRRPIRTNFGHDMVNIGPSVGIASSSAHNRSKMPTKFSQARP